MKDNKREDNPHQEPLPISESQLLNTGKLDAMRELMGEDFVELIPAYQESLESLFNELDQGVESGDMQVTQRVAHSIKSASLNVGAEALAKMALDLERQAKDGQVDHAGEKAHDLKITYTKLESLLHEYEKHSSAG